MAIIKLCRIKLFRNLTDLDITLNKTYNLIYGKNGSGKTSLLEAIYCIAFGKSLRSSSKDSIIQHNQKGFTIFTDISANEQSFKIGLEKNSSCNARMHINGEKSRSIATANQIIPVILIDPHSYGVIEHGPAYRRQYLDWLLFHVKQRYAEISQQYNKCLKQRNAALKQQSSFAICSTWDKQLIDLSAKISQARMQLINELAPVYERLVTMLDFNVNIDLCYKQGWAENVEFDKALRDCFDKDMALGYTTIGPQRADIDFLVNGFAASDVLSRGQAKLAVSCLLLAQGEYFRDYKKQTAVYLIDDLASELDSDNREKLFNLITQVPGQYLITATELDLFPDFLQSEATLFHVEQGELTTQ